MLISVKEMSSLLDKIFKSDCIVYNDGRFYSFDIPGLRNVRLVISYKHCDCIECGKGYFVSIETPYKSFSKTNPIDAIHMDYHYFEFLKLCNDVEMACSI